MKAPGSERIDFWHSLPKDDAWKQVTLGGQIRHGFRVQPMCKACQHRGEIMEIEDFCRCHGVSLDTPVLLVQMRLRCRSCRLPAGYFYMWNPKIPEHTGR